MTEPTGRFVTTFTSTVPLRPAVRTDEQGRLFLEMTPAQQQEYGGGVVVISPPRPDDAATLAFMKRLRMDRSPRTWHEVLFFGASEADIKTNNKQYIINTKYPDIVMDFYRVPSDAATMPLEPIGLTTAETYAALHESMKDLQLIYPPKHFQEKADE